MWELDHKEGWILKNSCFWTVLEKTLESPLDCKEIKPVNPKGNQPWIFIGRTDPEGEKLQYSGHLMWWANSEKTLMLRKIEGRRSRGQQRTRWLDSITDSVDMSKLREILVDRGAWRAAVHGAAKKQRRLSDWTTNNLIFRIPHKREQEVWSGCIHGKGLRQPQNPHWAGWWRFFSLHSVCLGPSVVSDSFGPNGLYPARLFHPWDSSGKNTGVGCHLFLQGIFLTHGSNLHLYISCIGRWVL